MRKIEILGVKFAKINLEGSLKKISDFVEKGSDHQVMTLNPEYLVRAKEDYQLKQTIANSSLIVVDGTGIILASWLIYLKSWFGGKKVERLTFRERVSGGELVEALARLAAKEGWKIGLVGGAPGVAEKALLELGANLKGFAHPGPENVRRETKEGHRQILTLIKQQYPRILFTSFGFYGPIWIDKLLTELRSRGGSLVAIEVGGVFNYLAGKSKRPPEFIKRIGLEWLWRLMTERWRIRRQLKLLKFVWMVVTET